MELDQSSHLWSKTKDKKLMRVTPFKIQAGIRVMLGNLSSKPSHKELEGYLSMLCLHLKAGAIPG